MRCVLWILAVLVSCQTQVVAGLNARLEPQVRNYVSDGQDNRDWMYGVRLGADTMGSGLYPVGIGATYLQGSTSDGIRKDYVFDAWIDLGGRSDMTASYLLGETTDGRQRDDIEAGVSYNIPPPSGHAGPLDLYLGGRQRQDEGAFWRGLVAAATLLIRPVKAAPSLSLIGEARFLQSLESLADFKSVNVTGHAGLSYGFWHDRLGDASVGASASAGYRWKELTDPAYAYLELSCNVYW